MLSILKKFLSICLSIGFCLFIFASLTACSNKTLGPETFKNYSAEQILAGGEKELSKGNYKESVSYFESLDALYPFGEEAKQGKLDIIYAYYKAEDHASAIAAADRYIRFYPNGKNVDYAYYMKGLINFDKDRTWLQRVYAKHAAELDLTTLQDAFRSFSELLKEFPKSIYAKDAEKRMLHIRELLAKRELETANFYFERKAYMAAANRASYVVEHFEGAAQTKDALKLMIKSYRALGVDKQAEDALRIFKLNFPGSAVY